MRVFITLFSLKSSTEPIWAKKMESEHINAYNLSRDIHGSERIFKSLKYRKTTPQENVFLSLSISPNAPGL